MPSTNIATDVPAHLLDVNVLIALSWPSHIHHARATRWWTGIERWATTPLTEAAFIRLSVNAGVVGRTVTVAEASALLRAIRATAGHEFVADDSTLARPVIDLTRVSTHTQITDAHLVNLAAGTDCVLATMDAGIPDMLAPSDRHHVLVLPSV